MQAIAQVDKQKQAYLTGYVSCSQYDGFKPVKFYIDTGSTFTTLLSVDIVKLGIDWRSLDQTEYECITGSGPAYPYALPNVVVGLRTLRGKKEKLTLFPLKYIHLLPPDDPTKIVPAQYEFAFSLLGMDVLYNFKHWHFVDKILLLKS